MCLAIRVFNVKLIITLGQSKNNFVFEGENQEKWGQGRQVCLTERDAIFLIINCTGRTAASGLKI